jgi:hypothetical protein
MIYTRRSFCKQVSRSQHDDKLVGYQHQSHDVINIAMVKYAETLQTNTFSHHQKMAGHSLVPSVQQSPQWQSGLAMKGVSGSIASMHYVHLELKTIANWANSETCQCFPGELGTASSTTEHRYKFLFHGLMDNSMSHHRSSIVQNQLAFMSRVFSSLEIPTTTSTGYGACFFGENYSIEHLSAPIIRRSYAAQFLQQCCELMPKILYVNERT